MEDRAAANNGEDRKLRIDNRVFRPQSHAYSIRCGLLLPLQRGLSASPSVSCATTDEPIEMPFGVADSWRSKEPRIERALGSPPEMGSFGVLFGHA